MARLESAIYRSVKILLFIKWKVACKLRDSQITVPYQATSLTTIVQMVANGIGITLLPQMAVGAGIASSTDLVIKPFKQAKVTRRIGLMWRKKTPRTVEFRQLGDVISGLIAV